MKKLALLLLALMFTQAYSQQKKLDKSSSFDLPEGTTSLLQLSNGNTLLLEITKKEGIKVMVFDTVRKKTASAKLGSKLVEEKIGYFKQEGFFEAGGDAALFLQVAEGRTPILVRLIIDGKTGKLKSEEKIASLDIIKGGGYAIAFGGLDMPDFEVSKDPESEYYVIVRYNSMAAETNNRIEALHYSPQHKLLNKAFYLAPNEKYKYTRYLNAYVNKDQYIVIATYGFNTDKTGGDEGRFYISQLNKGKTSFKQQELAYTDFYKKVQCTFAYNNSKQLLNMALKTDIHSKGNTTYAEYHFQNINPGTLKVDKEYSPDFTQVNQYYREQMENKKDFAGTLRKIGVDKSGNFILFFQELTITTSQQGTVRYWYGDVALITMSPAGKTINSAVFPANILGDGGSAFVDVVANENSVYILFNNSVENMNLPETKSAKPVKSPSVCVPVKYTYSGNSVKKEYLLKEPKEKKGNPYCDFSMSHYSFQSKKYAVVYYDPEKDKASIIWLTL